MCTYAHYIICKWSKVIPLNCKRHMYTQRGNFSLMEIVLMMAWHCVFERGIVFSCYAHSLLWAYLCAQFFKQSCWWDLNNLFLTLFLELALVIEEEMTRYHFKVKVRWRSKATLMTLHHLHWGELVLSIKNLNLMKPEKRTLKIHESHNVSSLHTYLVTLWYFKSFSSISH